MADTAVIGVVRWVHVATGGVVALLGLVALLGALRLDLFGDNDEPGPGFFPALLSGLLIVLGLVLAASYLFGTRRDPEHMEQLDLRAGRMGRSGAVWLTFVVTVALLPLVGFLVTSLLLVGFLVFAMERQRSVKAFAAVLVLPVATYLVFAIALEVQLPAWGFGS